MYLNRFYYKTVHKYIKLYFAFLGGCFYKIQQFLIQKRMPETIV